MEPDGIPLPGNS